MITFKKNELLTGTVTGLTHEGLGVVKIDNFPFFVENALPTEQIEIRVMKLKRNYGFARVERFITKSEHRVEDLNMDFLRTGIADLGHLEYAEQLKFKQEQVKTVLSKNAGLTDFAVLETLEAPEILHYRNKAQIPVRLVKNQLETGFFRKNSHDLIAIEDFYIQHEEIDQLIVAVRDLLRENAVKPYDEHDKSGWIRNLVIRRGYHTGELMLVFVVTSEKLPSNFDEILSNLTERFPNLKSVLLNINKSTGNAIFGKDSKLLHGQNFITDKMFDVSYQISAQSFYQVNTAQAERLYQVAYDFAELTKNDTIIDAYAGIGTIGLSIADKVKQIYGMEIVESAVENAQNNAKLNHIENAHYEVGTAEEILPKWRENDVKADVIFVDPPRKGLDESFILTATKMNARKIVYVSCNPASFARDVKIFQENGYELTKVQPVDLFPQTHHVEVVGLLTTKTPQA